MKNNPEKYISNTIIIKLFLILICCFAAVSCDWIEKDNINVWANVQTISGINSEFGEPFGVAVKGDEIFISDGEKGTVVKFTKDGKTQVLTDKLDTPSQIVFDNNGDLIVADSGTHTIKKIQKDGTIALVAGVEDKKGFEDGKVNEALFNAPIGVTVFENKIYVADTYNDRIRVIENGEVKTIAGSEKGFSDGMESKFDTPTSLATWKNGMILVADAGNRRIRVVEQNGNTWTLTGNGGGNLINGMLSDAEFVQPTAITVDKFGSIYVADGNAIRVIGRRFIPMVETISNDKHGFFDGKLKQSRFNRPSGLVIDSFGNLIVADSENQLVRAFTGKGFGKSVTIKEFEEVQVSSKEFRKISDPRWTYDPPTKKREIAGTLGEIRGGIKDEDSRAWFHNGLDIVGGYGETARFIRDEKVLRPFAVQNFETVRELLRMPTIGYIHIRLGRYKEQKLFDDDRFQFELDEEEIPIDVRIPRGTKFKAGEAIGTLNRYNHVHLIAGRSGREMNALDALILPNASDGREPKIEKVTIFNQNWDEIETEKENTRINLQGKVRIVVRAFDQMDGNAQRRKLGLYKIGYQVFDEEGEPTQEFAKPKWTIKFDKTPDNDAVKLVYAKGSQSGATGETIFNYIATNEVSGKVMQEGFFDTSKFKEGNYTLKVLVADFFGNIASEDIDFVIK